MAMCTVNWRERDEGLAGQYWTLMAAWTGLRVAWASEEVGQQIPRSFLVSPSWGLPS